MKLLFVLGLAIPLCGCIMGAGYSTKDRVTTAAREYNDGVRWGRYDQAAVHVAKERRKRFLETHKNLEDELEIADYELVNIDIDKSDHKNTKVTARVDYTWTLKRVGLVQRTTTSQVWEEKEGEWVVAKEERVKGVPLALFDEPARTEAAK